MGINFGELVKQYLDPKGDYNVIDGKSFRGGNRTTVGNVWYGDTKKPTSTPSKVVDNGTVTGNNTNTAAQIATSYYGGGGSGGSGGGGGSRASAAQLAEYDQGIGQVEHGLGRLDNQLNIALGNIMSQYNQRSNELSSSLEKGRGQYNTQTTQNQQQRRTNYNNISDQSAGGLRSLSRAAGARGAVGSDMQLIGRAVNDQANQQRSGAGETYARNQQGLDTNWGNFQKDIDDERRKVNDWKSGQENSARAQSQTTRQGLLQQLAQLRSQKASAAGANGANAARADLNRANALSGEIDALARVNPTYSGQRVDYAPKSLDSYTIGGSTAVGITPGNSGGDPNLNMYNTRNKEDDERNQRGMYL